MEIEEKRSPGSRDIFKSGTRKAFLLFMFFLPFLLLAGKGHADDKELWPLLNSAPDGGTINLDPAHKYVLNTAYILNKSVTIQSTVPGRVTVELPNGFGVWNDGNKLTIDGCTITSTVWTALDVKYGGELVVSDSQISSPGNTGIFVMDSTLTVTNSTITNCQFGVQLSQDTGGKGATAQLHTVTITDTPRAVQVTGSSSSVTIDQNSSFSYSGDGIGVAMIDGASATVRDSSFDGFLNAIDVQSSTTGGTAQVINCDFDNSRCSALCAVDARDVLFSGCRVRNALQDGVYFRNSTGVVENSEITGSLDSGVSFMGCENGATIRNCLVKDSGDQGLAVAVPEGTTSPPSLNVQVIGNTFVGNQVANLWVDSTSTAKITGNIFTQSPDFSVRFHGSKSTVLDSALVIKSGEGVEIKDGSTPTVVLSSIMHNNARGVLIYGSNSALTQEQSVFWANGASSTPPWSLYVNEGATVNSRYSTFGPAGDDAVINVTTGLCDMISNYWGASDGPSNGT